MKVLHMISGGDSGGAKTHVFALMRRLTKYCDVKIVCFIKGRFFDELQDIDVESVLLEQKNRFDLSVLDSLVEICQKDGIQIIHAHGARANFIASRLKKKVDIPVVTTVHSDYRLDFDGIYKKIVFTALNTLALRKLDYYIGVSSSFKDMLISRGFRPNSIYTVYNGMDYSAPFEYCSKEDFARRIGLEYNPDITYVGLIGRHDYVKGHDIFLDAAAKVLKQRKDVRFVIAGEGEGRDALVEQAKRLGITQYLTFAGFIKDIYSFLNFIDINTLSSRCESFPYVLLEGARMKKPTVSSAVGGIPDLIENGVTGLLFENQNSTQLADCIIRFVQNPKEAELCGQNLYNRATGSFSNDSLAKSHAEIYSAILRDRADKKRYDAVISGYYGYNNSGDDALLYGMIQSLKEQKPDIRLAVLSKNPDLTKKNYRTDSFMRFNIPEIKSILKQSHMLINGGGSLIQDATSFKSLMYYLYIMKLAKKRGLKLFVYANGIGPLKDSSLPYASKVLRGADMITLRDAESVKELERLDVGEASCMLSADPALVLDAPNESFSHSVLKRCGIPDNIKIMLISVRPWAKNDPDFKTKLAHICDSAFTELGLTAVFLPMKPSTDIGLCQEISSMTQNRSYVITETLDVKEAMAAVSAAYISIGMRLHALVYSMCALVPSVGLTYDPKIDGFTSYIGNNMTVSAEKIDENAVMCYLKQICENYDDIKDSMNERLSKLKELAKDSARAAVKML